MHLRGEINLSTKSESLNKKKYSRKEKHKSVKNYWAELLIIVLSSSFIVRGRAAVAR